MTLKERKQLNAGKENTFINQYIHTYIHCHVYTCGSFLLFLSFLFFLIRSGLLSGNKRGPAALAGNLSRSSPQQDDSSATGRPLHIYTYIDILSY